MFDDKRFIQLRQEYRAIYGDYPVAMVEEYKEGMESGKLSLFGEEISGLTIYRGWMMKPEMYSDFYKLLEQKGIYLINTPEEYER